MNNISIIVEPPEEAIWLFVWQSKPFISQLWPLTTMAIGLDNDEVVDLCQWSSLDAEYEVSDCEIRNNENYRKSDPQLEVGDRSPASINNSALYLTMMTHRKLIENCSSIRPAIYGGDGVKQPFLRRESDHHSLEIRGQTEER